MLHDIDEEYGTEYPHYNIYNNKIFHNSFRDYDFNVAILPQKNSAANIVPVKKIPKVTAPDDPGIKNPITDEAKSSFATSARVFAINLI